MTRQKTLKKKNSRNGVVSITPDAQSRREQERLRQADCIEVGLYGGFFSRASVLHALKRYYEVLLSYEKVEEHTSGSVQMYVNRGVLFNEMKRYPAAIADFGKPLVIKPDSDFLFGQFLHSKMHIFDWQDFTNNISEFERKIRIGSKVSPAFPVLALLDSPALQLEVVRIFVALFAFSFGTDLQYGMRLRLAASLMNVMHL
ncbi:MAG: hypothetical protein WBP54_09175 [Pelodictyon phaeoclathratiforme]